MNGLHVLARAASSSADFPPLSFVVCSPPDIETRVVHLVLGLEANKFGTIEVSHAWKITRLKKQASIRA